MIRFDNVLFVVLLILLGHAIVQVAEVLNEQGPAMTRLYEELFSPAMRPVFKLEVLLFCSAMVFRIWHHSRRHIEEKEPWDSSDS